jgi:hypothetical protein
MARYGLIGPRQPFASLAAAPGQPALRLVADLRG